jgi:hypothetical protein
MAELPWVLVVCFLRGGHCRRHAITEFREDSRLTVNYYSVRAGENPTWLHTGLNVPALAILHFSHDWNCSVLR